MSLALLSAYVCCVLLCVCACACVRLWVCVRVTQYYDPVFSRNGDHPRQYPGMYSTDVVASKALGYLQTAVAAGKRMTLVVACMLTLRMPVSIQHWG